MSRWRPRVSIRYKVLGLVVAVVIAAMVTYLVLAIALFTKDKLAYVYDLNATLARTLGEEVQSAMSSLTDRLLVLGSDSTVDASRVQPLAERLFGADPDVVGVEVWSPHAGAYERSFVWMNPGGWAAAHLVPEDLALACKANPMPWSTVAAEHVVLQNSSLAPDIALLSLGVMAPANSNIVVAHFRPDRLLRIFGESGIYTAFLVDRRGSVLVHPEPSKVIRHTDESGLKIVRDALEGKAERGVRAFVGSGGIEFIGAFARIETAHLAVVTQIPKSEALAAAKELVRTSTLFAIGILFAGMLVSIFFSRRLTAPIRRLVEATRVLGTGHFEIEVKAESRDEVGALAEAFNRMAHELLVRDRQLEETHQQLLQSARLAAVGEMAAGISHEVRNPMVGIRGFAQMGQSVATVDQAREYFKVIAEATTRATEILENVLRFSRRHEAAFGPLDLNTVVTEAIRLVRHQLQVTRVKLDVTLSENLPWIRGNNNQLQQVLLNLMINAQQAMQGRQNNCLYVATKMTGPSEVCVSIRDTGCGMSDETKSNLFRAFFSTKPDGTGLGLSVSQRIVTDHKGRIEVDTRLDAGTTFKLFFPTAAAFESLAQARS